MKKYKLSEFQLSQAYLFYWDKIEKANYFLESILDTISEEIDSRLVQALMTGPVSDGGQWGGLLMNSSMEHEADFMLQIW
jgi:bleomycin hydrolase